MEKIVAQARVYYIIGYGRDSSTYEDKKWVLGKVYFSEKRMIFRKIDRYVVINYGDIISIDEKDKYSRISPPMGWSRGSILEIKHYEDQSRAHVLLSLISADFDVVTKMKAIISKFALGESRNIDEMHKKFLLLVSLGIRDGSVIRYVLGLTPEKYESVFDDLKLNGLLNEEMELTSEGRKMVYETRKRI